MLHTFFWGDFERAVNEETINYPLMASYYPSASILDNQTSIPITIVLADKIYTDYSNLNDVESDTLQYCRHIFNIMNKSKRWQLLGRVESCSVTKFIESNADICAGHIMTVNFMLRDSNSICDLPMSGYDFDQAIGSSCLPVQIYRNGVLVDTVESGGMYSYTTDAFTYTIKNTALDTLYSGNVTANLDVTIQDSTAVLKDTSGTTISTTSILAEGSEDIVAPDATYLVEYVNGTLIESGSILAEGSVTVQVPNPVTCEDATVNVNGAFWDSVPSGGTENVIVRQSSGSTQVGSIQGQFFRIADSTAVLKTTGGTTISTTSIKAEASQNIVAPNTTIEVNGTTEGTVVAGATVDIQLSNPSGTVTPTSVTQVGNDLQVVLPASATIPVGAKLMKTGQTTSYRTGDDGDLEAGRDVSFFVLASNNPFGNTNRFTDELGGQTYTNNIVIDWSTYNGSTVLGYYRVLSGNITWDSAIDQCVALSVSTFTSGWRLANRKEVLNVYNEELLIGLNYAPFNIAVTVWTSTTWKFTTTNAYTVASTGPSSVALKSGASGQRIAVRTFTVTGTTLS
jgi:hypothetical protein